MSARCSLRLPLVSTFRPSLPLVSTAPSQRFACQPLVFADLEGGGTYYLELLVFVEVEQIDFA
jgi:hypothetical protein